MRERRKLSAAKLQEEGSHEDQKNSQSSIMEAIRRGLRRHTYPMAPFPMVSRESTSQVNSTKRHRLAAPMSSVRVALAFFMLGYPFRRQPDK